MARQVLDNGVILPAEYSDDWYDDMTSNLTKLDEVIGSNAEKLSASDVGAAAISNDYDDLDNKPAYNILRRASVTLTAGGTGNYTDLDSDSKIKAGDYVLDAANKLYSITAIDAANSTYTVSAAALINITDKSELGAAALSNSYDDLSNLPGYGILRFCSTAITDNSSVPFSSISSVSKIAAGDFLLDTAGKLYQIASIDTVNETAAVTTPITQLALDAFVVHVSGNETIAGEKTFSEYITSDGSTTGDEYSNNAKTNLWLMSNRDTEEVSGVLFDTYRQNTAQGTGIHIIGLSIKENSVRYEGCRWGWYWDNNLNGYILDFKPTTQGVNQAVKRNLGTSTDKWDTINGINPGSLSLPDLNSGVDISGSITVPNAGSTYTPVVDGWISIILKSTSGALGCFAYQGHFACAHYSATALPNETEPCIMLSMPVVKGVTVNILTKGSNAYVYSAKFYPCLGNV